MITGYNTDIVHNGVTYHVQTEDKGLKSPMILSLVYHRGTILASKRSPYDDLLLGEFDEKELSDRLHRQHKLICAAIRAGRVEELKRMKGGNGVEVQRPVAKKSPVPAVEERAPVLPNGNAARTSQPITSIKQALNGSPLVSEPVREEVPPIPKPLHEKQVLEPIVTERTVNSRNSRPGQRKTAPPAFEKPEIPLPEISDSEFKNIPEEELFLDEPIVDGVSIIEDEIILPAEAVEVIAEPTEALEPDHLGVRLVNEVEFRGGEGHLLSVIVCRSQSGNYVPSASVMVKVMGASFKPLIFHSKTDTNGVAVVHMQIPHFSRGRSAILIKAMVGNEEAEIRRVILPG